MIFFSLLHRFGLSTPLLSKLRHILSRVQKTAQRKRFPFFFRRACSYAWLAYFLHTEEIWYIFRENTDLTISRKDFPDGKMVLELKIMSKQKMQVSFQELLFYGYFCIMLLIKGLGYADGTFYKLGFLAALLLAIAKILTTAYTGSEWVIVSVLSVLALVNRVVTRLDSMLFVIPLILCMKRISVRKTMHLGAFVWSAAFFFQVVTHLLGIRSFDFVVHSKFGLDHVIRWAMGYVHPNVLQISYDVLIFYLVYSCCKSRRSFQKAFLLSSAGAVYLFVYSMSRTGMIMFAVFWMFLGMEYLVKKFPLFQKQIWMTAVMALLPLEAVSSIALPLLLEGKVYEWLERVMTHRPALTCFFFSTYGVRLFGQNPEGLAHYLTLDCSYANLLFHGGILLFALLMAGCFLLVFWETKAYSEHGTAENGVELAITLTCLMGAVSEPFAFNTSFKNVSLLFLGGLLFRNRKGKKEYSLFPQLQMWLTENGWDVRPLADAWADIGRAAHGLAQNIRKWRKKTITFGIAFMFVCVCLYFCKADHIQTYYVCAVNTDESVNEEDCIYLSEREIRELEEDPAVRVLNYQGPEIQMARLEGDIGIIEFGRGLLSTIVWSFAGGVVLAAVMESIILHMSSGKRRNS